MAEINAQIPLSYVYGPTIGDHLKSAMSLADARDMMRTRRVQTANLQQEMAQASLMNPLKIQEARQVLSKNAQTYQAEQDKLAREEKLRRTYGSEYAAIKDREAAEPMPTEPAPIPEPEPIQPRGVETAKSVYDAIQAQGEVDPSTYKSMSESYKAKGLTIPAEIISDIANKTMTYEQFLADEKTPGLTKWNKASIIDQEAAKKEAEAKYASKLQEYPEQIERQKQQYTAQLEEYNKDIPAEFKWMDRETYKRYLDRAALSPEFGEKYLNDLVDKRSKMAKDSDFLGKTPTGIDLRLAKDKDYVDAQLEILKGYLDNGKINQESYNALYGVVKTRPVSWQSQLPIFLGAKETGQALGNVKTAEEIEKLRKEKEKLTREEKEAATKASDLVATSTEVARQTNENIDRLINDFETKKGKTGVLPSLWADIYPPSEAGTRKAYFQQIKESLTLKKLTDLKAAGGTLGALSDRERTMLENAASILDFRGSPQRNIEALRNIKKTLNSARERSGSSGSTNKTSSGNRFTWE